MKINTLLITLLVVVLFTASAQGYTKEEVVKRGVLQCGVSTGTPGFSTVDAAGNWSGLDVDICRAVAAATLGDGEKVEFLPLAANESFTALLSGEVDILARHAIWTFTRDSALAVHFTGTSYYDGQGFLVSKKLGVKEAGDLRKVKVCSSVGSQSEVNLKDYFQRNKVDYKLVPYDSEELAVKGFEGGACELLSLPQSRLYGILLELDDPESAEVLPDVFTKEPLGPVVRQGDDVWFNIVKWCLFAMINGEELGVTSLNIDEMKLSHKLDIKRLFGFEGSGGKGVGLRSDWAAEIIRQVGNYGEVFEKNLGAESPLKIERGLNRLWSRGGVQYAPPLR
ncbi:MAG: amino acid ABC transporter substrate-binding protein [Desulfobulbaceae bacterium]|nr:amino acid ABC transporter substrate-binding protein [Desulfobulbaceae bacterium]